MIVWLDGSLIPEEQAAISIHDRGFLFSDGVFETTLLFRGGFFRLRPHLQRFAASAAAMRLPAPPTEEVERSLRELVDANDIRDGNVRITLTRGVRHPVLLMTVRPPDTASAEKARRGWSLVTAATRRPSTEALPAQLKALGRTYALLARHEAADAGVDDALLLTDGGHVCEGPSWNIFWRRDRTLFTPALEAGVLAGVTRTVLLEIAASAGYRTEEGLWQRSALDDADEIFATMTSVGLVPVHSLDGRVLHGPASASAALHDRYWAVVAAESA